jgi:pSer/pThr/pTyr-binding forkhead associated (FHA) protein
MSHLEIAGQRVAIPAGEFVIGSDPAAHMVLEGTGMAGRHAAVQSTPDGQSAIRLADEAAVVLVNGVRLGAQPVPLLHGDKIEMGEHELHFVDERRSGSTQYVQAVDPSQMSAKPSARRAPTAGTGGRLVSLTDGREYAVTGASLVIGRDAGCDVVVTSKNVSRRHCEVVTTPKGYLLVDSSTNGTFVNGERIEAQHLLARGDVIRCGDYDFRFYGDVAPGPPADPAPPPTPEPREAEPPAPPNSMPPPEPAARQPSSPPTPPPGAVHQLKNTMHGVPAVPRPGAAPRGRPAPPYKPPAAAVTPPAAPPTPPVAPTPSVAAEQAPGGPTPTAEPRPSGSTLMANIIVRSGPLKGKRFPIRVPVVNVGRADYNDIAIDDDSVSTTHAKLQRREGIWVLVDLDSTNGTLVDGERVHGEVPLAPGALIRFGEVQTIFEPTDDTIDPKKGSSTRMMGAIRLPNQPPSGSQGTS